MLAWSTDAWLVVPEHRALRTEAVTDPAPTLA
jgi:hypothetical protein